MVSYLTYSVFSTNIFISIATLGEYVYVITKIILNSTYRKNGIYNRGYNLSFVVEKTFSEYVYC